MDFGGISSGQGPGLASSGKSQHIDATARDEQDIIDQCDRVIGVSAKRLRHNQAGHAMKNDGGS
jgi:hypothetical protein